MIGSVVGSVFGFMLLVGLLVGFCCCVVIDVPGKRVKITDLRIMIVSKLKVGDIEQLSSEEAKAVDEDLNSSGNGSRKKDDQASLLKLGSIKTQGGDEGTDQYDSLSRTLVIQKMLQEKSPIKQVRDPYSESVIEVGVVVVVVKEFLGSEANEFKMLQTGDLLRVMKFYYKEPKKEKQRVLQLSKQNDQEEQRVLQLSKQNDQEKEFIDNNTKEEFIDQDDLKYDQIYCTGVILNTYLEYDGGLSIRFRPTSEIRDGELMKDFPLSSISLETTVLRSV